MIQYSIRQKRSAIRAQAVYFLHSTMRSVTCLRLSDVSVICRVTYFQLPIQSAFLPYIGRQAAPALWCTIGFNTQIGHRTLPKIWVGTFPVRSVQPGGNTLVKMETRHFVEGQFGSEFPAICIHCGFMAS